MSKYVLFLSMRLSLFLAELASMAHALPERNCREAVSLCSLSRIRLGMRQSSASCEYKASRILLLVDTACRALPGACGGGFGAWLCGGSDTSRRKSRTGACRGVKRLRLHQLWMRALLEDGV